MECPKPEEGKEKFDGLCKAVSPDAEKFLCQYRSIKAGMNHHLSVLKEQGHPSPISYNIPHDISKIRCPTTSPQKDIGRMDVNKTLEAMKVHLVTIKYCCKKS